MNDSKKQTGLIWLLFRFDAAQKKQLSDTEILGLQDRLPTLKGILRRRILLALLAVLLLGFPILFSSMGIEPTGCFLSLATVMLVVSLVCFIYLAWQFICVLIINRIEKEIRRNYAEL